MRRIRLIILSLILCVLPAAGQTVGTDLARLRAFVGNAATFNRLFPQEKVFIQTDNVGYYVGEDLWYKAYVVRTDQGRYTNLSRVLYIELLDSFGEVVETQKLPLTDGQCDGRFRLNQLLSGGFYELRAYTRYGTNFDSRGTFSRTIPIFDRPEVEGDYSNRTINVEIGNARREGNIPDTLSVKERKRILKELRPLATFYPEGGRLVRGLLNRVAYSVALPDSCAIDVTAEVRDAAGNVFMTVKTEREGRGSFLCLPDTAQLYFCFTYDGRDYRTPLPEIQPEGCVLTVNAVDSLRVGIQVAATPAAQGQLLGLSLMQNGNTTYFDTLRLAADPWTTTLVRDDLTAGVHTLTLFDTKGRIYAQRQFFIAPRDTFDLQPVTATFADSTIAPYKQLTLRLQSAPHANFALAVHDAATLTHLDRTSAATQWLLSSELKGFVRNAPYYFEANDAVHRQAADLLCLVQGWTRYNWREMTGTAPFVKRQPIEDSLYVDGRILPRLNYRGSFWTSKKKKRRTLDLAYNDIGIALYNDQGFAFRGKTKTDSSGYFAFVVPSLTGKWELSIHASKDGEDSPHLFSLNRLFSPQVKLYNFYETEIRSPRRDNSFAFNADDAVYERAQAVRASLSDTIGRAGRDNQLGEAVVSVKGDRWAVKRRRAMRNSQMRFDVQRAADEYLDRGEEPPGLNFWLLTKPFYAKEVFKNRRAVGFVFPGERSAVWFYTGDKYFIFTEKKEKEKKDDEENKEKQGGQETSTDSTGMDGLPIDPLSRYLNYEAATNYDYGDTAAINRGVRELQADMKNEDLLLTLEDWQEAYISFKDFGTRYFLFDANNPDPDMHRIYESHPFYVFAFPMAKTPSRFPAYRHTTFYAYNEQETYYAPTYAVPPAEPDYRRTLYWSPNVVTDDAGRAEVSFYNNTTARRLDVTLGGITPDGRPVVKQ